MTSSRRGVGALLLLLAASAPVYSQSLGDVARQEEARRSTAQKAKRSFSDADLGPRAIAAAETAQSCYVSVTEGRCVDADAIIANSQANIASGETKRQEPMVRQEAAAIRVELARVQRELDELAATAADGSLPDARRSAAVDTLAKRQAILEHMKQRWARLEKYVAQQRVPRAWIEPVPDSVSRDPR